MEKMNTGDQESHMIWISRSEHIVSFHEIENDNNDNYEPLVFSNHNEKMQFVLEKCSSGFRIQ